MDDESMMKAIKKCGDELGLLIYLPVEENGYDVSPLPSDYHIRTKQPVLNKNDYRICRFKRIEMSDGEFLYAFLCYGLDDTDSTIYGRKEYNCLVGASYLKAFVPFSEVVDAWMKKK